MIRKRHWTENPFWFYLSSGLMAFGITYGIRLIDRDSDLPNHSHNMPRIERPVQPKEKRQEPIIDLPFYFIEESRGHFA